MKQLVINGNKKLKGEIKISGAKNSVVALIPAAILSDEGATLYNIPDISDTKSLLDILNLLNCNQNYNNEILTIDTKNLKNEVIKEELSKKLRASYYFMGALLAKFNYVEIYFPGGCNIGSRPIDFHINGFKKLGAEVEIEGNKYIFRAKKLKGADIYLDFASVGATINIMLAAVKAEGKTTISNAAKEPEIVNVASFLNSMGAKISGVGSNLLTIEGVEKLHGCEHRLLPDMIEIGSFIGMAALTQSEINIKNVGYDYLGIIPDVFKRLGIKLERHGDDIFIPEQ